MTKKDIAIITGASQGIGKATSQRFQEAGWQIYNLSRSPSPLPGVENCPIDLQHSTAIEKLCKSLRPKWEQASRICVIHNASAYYRDSVANLDPLQLQETLAVGLMAPILLNQQLLPLLQQKSGSSILYIGSTLSEKAVAGAASYVILKHAVVGLMRSTCQDLAGLGIHTACICPGFTDTELLQRHIGDKEKIWAALASRVSANRLIAPAEIAALLYFCAENPVIDGSVLHAHLGQLEK